MDKKHKKQKPTENRVGKVYFNPINFINKSDFPSLQKIAEHQQGIIKRTIETMQPALENLQTPEEYVIPVRRSVDYDILEVLHELKEQNIQRKKEIDLFYFNEREKTLEHNTRTRSFTYKFSEKGMNFKLVKILINKDDFHQTRHLREDLESKSNEAVRKKVSEVNKKINQELKLDENFKFIVGEAGPGYKINPDIKIKVIEE